jgi:cysteine synthase A
VGTGGTITGTGRYLKEKYQEIEIWGIEPKNSPVLSGGKAGLHGIQGIGAGFIPKVLDKGILDHIHLATEEESYLCARRMAREEGILVGISSGAALSLAIKLSQDEKYKGKTIVALLPDSGERYLSTPLYED